jgi:NADH:ubiquinone oxidoreductase subunit 5 (subunit L)/multisubunit Na+/H+ antiporter MnhA subunit
MRWTVGVLAVLSTIGGFLQFAPLWDPVTKWLEPVAAPIAAPTNAEEWAISGIAVAVGLAGIAVAWAIYAAKRVPAPKPVRLFQKKFYWDELYDYLFYYPSDLLARGLYAFVEKPLIGGSISAVTGSASYGSRELARAQTGLVRSYALALAGGLAILAVVFLAAR